MAVNELVRLKPTANEILLNAIRDDASPDYQARITEATKGGVQAQLKQLQNYRPAMNEFFDALVNKIGLTLYHERSFTNPLKEFKRGLLQNGDTIEDINVGLIKAKTYDPKREYMERDLFGTNPIEIQSNFHKVNRRDRYDITIPTQGLQSAFTSDFGLHTFAGKIMAAPGVSDEWDEFTLMCALFGEYEANGGYFKVGVRDVTNPESTTREEDSKDFLTKVREMASTLAFLSTRYNAAHMPTAAQPDDLVLFMTPRLRAVLDVEALAGAFNVEKMALSGRIYTIPEENFGIDGAQALLTTRDFFVVADQVFETASQWNPAALQNNYFLHHWQVISASRFVPALLFTTKGGDETIRTLTPVTSVSAITIADGEGDTVTDVTRGNNYSLDATAVTNPADGLNAGVRWTVTGATSPRTSISPTGVLTVGGDEGATSLTVRATSTWLDPANLMRNGKYSEASYTVVGPVTVKAWPDVDNPDTTADDAQAKATGITVKGVAVSPTFAPGTTSYTVNLSGAAWTAKDVKVQGVDSGDVQVTKAGAVATIEVAGAPGDPVYTVTVS